MTATRRPRAAVRARATNRDVRDRIRARQTLGTLSRQLDAVLTDQQDTLALLDARMKMLKGHEDELARQAREREAALRAAAKAREQALLAQARARRAALAAIAQVKAKIEAQVQAQIAQARRAAETQAAGQAEAQAQSQAQSQAEAIAQARALLLAQQRASGALHTDATRRVSGPVTTGNAAADAVVALAEAQVGKPYAPLGPYQRNGPDRFDCQGLVFWVFKQFGITLPNGATAQYDAVQHISAAEARPGDLVFFHREHDAHGWFYHHVGIVTGPGTMVNALNSASGVRDDLIDDISDSDGWVSYGRALNSNNTKR